MIAVFKTNVFTPEDAMQLVNVLKHHYPLSCINFDLHDCDKILRIDGGDHLPGEVIRIVNEHGFSCTELE